jgi:hypothetical protein
LKLVAYEAGPDTFGPNNIAAKKAASLDPRMKDLTVKELNQWFGAGGGLIDWYVAGPTNYDTQYGTWGLTNAIDNLNTPKMQGIEQVEAAGVPGATAGFAAPGTIPAIQYVGSTQTTDAYPRYLHNGATLDYLVDSPADGHYTLTVNYAEVTAGGQLRVWVNGVPVKTLSLPVTGSSYDSQWAPNSFADAQAIPLDLRAGVNNVRLEVVSEGFTLNALKFAGASQPGQPMPPVNPVQSVTTTTTTTTTTTSTATPTPSASSGLSYVTGFSSVGLTTNGYAGVRSGRLRLTNGGYQRGSAFFQSPVGTSRFATTFDFLASNGSGDGIAFVLQNAGATALGAGGGGLGYAGIGRSLAVKFDINGTAGIGANMVGLAINGGTPVGPALNLGAAGIDLRSGHEIRAGVNYDAGVLTVTVVDMMTGKTARLNVALNLAQILGASSAFAGFTAATGGISSTQDILDWSYAVVPAGQPMPRIPLIAR